MSDAPIVWGGFFEDMGMMDNPPVALTAITLELLAAGVPGAELKGVLDAIELCAGHGRRLNVWWSRTPLRVALWSCMQVRVPEAGLPEGTSAPRQEWRHAFVSHAFEGGCLMVFDGRKNQLAAGFAELFDVGEPLP